MKDTNERVATQLAEAVNSFCDEKKVAQHLAVQHRTLQQTFTRVCVYWLKQLATTEYFDDRNAASVQLAKDLMNIPAAKEILDRGLPMV